MSDLDMMYAYANEVYDIAALVFQLDQALMRGIIKRLPDLFTALYRFHGVTSPNSRI